MYLCEYFKLHEVAEYFYQVIKINNYTRERFATKIVHKMFDTLSNKKLAVFGFAFKQGTSDTRESSAIFICKALLEERAKLHIYDPKVPEQQIRHDLTSILDDTYYVDNAMIPEYKENPLVKSNVVVEQDPYAAVKDAHAIIILTEWNEFKTYDYEKMFNLMRKPAFLFDGRNITDMKK